MSNRTKDEDYVTELLARLTATRKAQAGGRACRRQSGG